MVTKELAEARMAINPPLSHGEHSTVDGCCALELLHIAVTGAKLEETPAGVSRPLSYILSHLNDGMDPTVLDGVLRPYVLRIALAPIVDDDLEERRLVAMIDEARLIFSRSAPWLDLMSTLPENDPRALANYCKGYLEYRLDKGFRFLKLAAELALPGSSSSEIDFGGAVYELGLALDYAVCNEEGFPTMDVVATRILNRGLEVV